MNSARSDRRLPGRAGRDGLLPVLHAEWTKFRTVRAWVTGIVSAPLMVVLVALLAGASSDQKGSPHVPIGPGGEPVTDSFYFVHRALTGDGSITVSISELRSNIPVGLAGLQPGLVPWAKSGLILKASTRPGSPYVAIMVTGDHGVRMQDNYVNDTAGEPGSFPAASVRWLRLSRSGDAVTGSASGDGMHWTVVGTTHTTGFGPIGAGGLFVASPPSVDGHGTLGTVSTARFGDLRIQGRWTGGTWTGDQMGPESPTFAGYPANTSGSFTAEGDHFTVTGAGDIAPAVRETLPAGGTLEDILTGTFPALITVTVLGALYITTEYRDDLISATLAATPRRGQVLMAKAIVLGACAFVAGLAGTIVATPLGQHLSAASNVTIFPVTPLIELRVALGTGALLGTAAVLALAVGSAVRHSTAAVTIVTAGIVLPYLLMANPFMPASVSTWLTSFTPAAAFAVQQTLVPYPQVASIYTPYDGYFPLAPAAGLAVLMAYAMVSLALATVLLRRTDP